MDKVSSAAALSAEHLSCLVKLTETWIKRQDGLTMPEKILTILNADVQHIKALHVVIQSGLNESERTKFSAFLRSMAETEEREEKGGTPPAGS